MAVNALTVKQILSRVREIFPKAQETYMMALINDALTEAGKYNVKYESAKTSSVADKMWYTINDTDSGIEVSKVFKVSFMDNDDDYRQIPRITWGDITVEDLV